MHETLVYLSHLDHDDTQNQSFRIYHDRRRDRNKHAKAGQQNRRTAAIIYIPNQLSPHTVASEDSGADIDHSTF
eukprot:3423099-Pyramimonas_sp.AAC.1